MIRWPMPDTRIIGKRIGGEPENEADNFIECPECHQLIDMRDLGEVLRHEEPGHKARLNQ